MNAVAAAVLLALVATCTATSVVSSGQQVLYSPSAVQYVSPYQYQYQYVQPSVASSSVVSQSVPVTYASSAVVPSTSYVAGYPYAYNYGLNYGLNYALLKK